LEANAKADPSILIAAKILKDKIPDIATALIESHPHVAYSETSPAQGYIKNGEFRVKSRKLTDGSLIQPTDIGRKSLMRILQKFGWHKTSAQKAVSFFDEAPENKRVEIAPGLEAVKWSIDRLEVNMTRTGIMDPLIPTKTAYEFLSCYVGSAIYDDSLHLSQIRESITNKKMNPDVLQVERLSSNKYEPFHGICFEGGDPYAKVQIRLFGWLAFRVHFLHWFIGGPRYAYTHRLDTNEERIGSFNDSA